MSIVVFDTTMWQYWYSYLYVIIIDQPILLVGLLRTNVCRNGNVRNKM